MGNFRALGALIILALLSGCATSFRYQVPANLSERDAYYLVSNITSDVSDVYSRHIRLNNRYGPTEKYSPWMKIRELQDKVQKVRVYYENLPNNPRYRKANDTALEMLRLNKLSLELAEDAVKWGNQKQLDKAIEVNVEALKLASKISFT